MSRPNCDQCAACGESDDQRRARFAAGADLNPLPPREGVRPPVNEDEWRAWDTYAAAALTGSLWWNQHRPIAADDPARDAALIADEMLELRRRRKRSGQ